MLKKPISYKIGHRCILRKILGIFATLLLFAPLLSYADQNVYQINEEGKTFDVKYVLDGNVLAMDADVESTSILIGTTNVEDSIFEISFPSELLAAQDADFIVLVDGFETEYTVTYDGDNPSISFPIAAGTEEIEIIGTSVVPEFPFGALLVMGVVASIAVLLTKGQILGRNLV